MSGTAPSRRSVLSGGALTAAAGVVGFLVARRADAAKAPSVTTAANAYGAPVAPQEQLLTSLDKVPPGGGLILTGHRIVIIRDSSGSVHAFSATCTHQGCPVDSIKNGKISCPCHGSQFDASTGQVVQGPAARALPEVTVVVRDGNVYTG